ncbi:MAG TPA: helix-turn-helix domain-containing protein [Thermomicrobiales bacterium]|nr:helix-turn-helix domain-containing protein [Thermomicrobiales bacterium]
MLACMYRIALTDGQRRELRERTRQAGLAPSTRDRLEMVRLADAGWGVPRIARHLGRHEQTVRAWVKAFLAGGFDALPDKPRGGKQSALTAPMLESVRAELAAGARTWTAAQLADWVADRHGVRLSADRLRIHLRRATSSWQRPSRTLRHKQDPAEVAAREAVPAERAKKGPPA